MINITKLCQWVKVNAAGTTLRLAERSGCIHLDVEVMQDDAVAYASFNLNNGMLSDAEVRQHILATMSEVE